MTFVEHLKCLNLISESQSNEIYEAGADYYLTVKKKKIVNEEILIREACTYYHLSELKNSLALKANRIKATSIAGFKQLIERQIFAFETNDALYFLIDNPDDIQLIDKIIEYLPLAKISIAKDDERNIFSKRFFQPLEIEEKALQLSVDAESRKGTNEPAIQSEAQHLYQFMLNAALENRASDLHIIPTKNYAKIDFRIDGKVTPYTEIPLNILPNIKNIICNAAQIGVQSNINLPIVGKMAYPYHGHNIDIRINIIPAKLGFDINLRFLSDELKNIQDIGFTQQNIDRYRDLLAMTKGLVVITGPTGSGKTTTLYAGLTDISGGDRKIVTLEDPVEITLPGITQIDINKDNQFDYEQGVASVLRHDPDIILIGEIRTKEVADEAIRSSDTGHLALTTLHTRDSVSAISRLINLGIRPYALGDSLTAVIAQRLVRRICPYCKEEYVLDDKHPWKDMFELSTGEINLVRAKGCIQCDGRGYLGRLAITEFLVITPEISIAIQNQANRYEIIAMAKKHGFKSMVDDGVEKALLHLTTLEEIEQLQKENLNGREKGV